MKKTLRTNLFLLIFFVASILLENAIVLAVRALMPEYATLVSSALCYLLCYGGAIAIFFISSKEKVSDSLGLKFFSPLSFLFVILIPLLLIPTMLLVSYATGTLLGSNAADTMIKSFTDNNVPLWLALLLLAGVPALFEEIFFRGILLNAYRRFPIWVGVLFTSVAFSVFHLSIDQLAYTLLAGVVFALMSAWTESVLPAILGHIVLNSFSVVLAYLPANINTEINAFVYRSANSPWLVFGACAILTLPLLILVMIALRKDCQTTKARFLARYGKGSSNEEKATFPAFSEMWPMYLFCAMAIALIVLAKIFY